MSTSFPALILPPNPEILFGHSMPTLVPANATPNTVIASSHARLRKRRRFICTSGVSATGGATSGGGGPGSDTCRERMTRSPVGPALRSARRRTPDIASSMKPMTASAIARTTTTFTAISHLEEESVLPGHDEVESRPPEERPHDHEGRPVEDEQGEQHDGELAVLRVRRRGASEGRHGHPADDGG